MSSYRLRTRLDMLPFWAEVFSGEYDSKFWPKHCDVVVDVGANVGAFGVWAATRFGTDRVHAYEPQAAAMELLSSNLGSVGVQTVPVNAAVHLGAAPGHLVPCGRKNAGEYEFVVGERPEVSGSVPVVSVPAADLPDCDFLKVDTEGSEVPIISGLFQAGKYPTHIVLEYHSAKDLGQLVTMFAEHNYVTHTLKAFSQHRGILGASRVAG